MVINQYVNREMATIEYKLEKEEPTFRDLEVYLKDLYIYRRRCTKYHELINEARDQCSRRGQASWSRSGSSVAIEHARDIEGDFSYLLARTQGTIQRIEKNINLLASLVSIGAAKQGLDESHSVSRLNLLAIIFLPFSTIAAILGMQGNYAPGAESFWLFWTVAISLTAGIIGMSALHGWIAKLMAYRFMRTARFNL
jgi:Mg2+ and Co2+ transporter CorA